MPGIITEHPPGAPHYKTEEEVEGVKWTNYGNAIYKRILELSEHDFKLQTEKQFEVINYVEELRMKLEDLANNNCSNNNRNKSNNRNNNNRNKNNTKNKNNNNKNNNNKNGGFENLKLLQLQAKIQRLLCVLLKLAEMFSFTFTLNFSVIQKIFDLPDVSDFDQGVFSGIGDRIQKTRLTLRHNVLLGTGTHGKPRPVGGAGVAKVVSNPSFPENGFFQASRLFRVILRHNNLAFEDDTMLDGRVTCIRLMEEKKPGSYVDFILHTGSVSQFYNAQSFEEFLQAFKEGKNGLREWLLKKPVHLYGRIENVRRDPKSFYDMRYHSHVTYKFEASDGRARVARFRLVPALDVDETGQLNPDEQESVWDFDRLASDPREADYLRAEYRRRLSHSALQYILQMQVVDEEEWIQNNPSDGFHNFDEIYNPCVAWDYKTNPWHDVTIITITTPLVEDHLAHVDFSLGNHVTSLHPMEANSLREFNSLSLAMKHFHGVPSKAEERELGFYGTNTKRTTFKISVHTGDLPSAGTDADVTIDLTGGLGRTGAIPLERKFQDDFEPGKAYNFEVTGPFISDVYVIELEMKTSHVRAWYVDHVTIVDQATRRTSHFPVHRWITTMEPLAVVRRAEAIPPHLETLPTLYILRKQEIQERRKLYQWQEEPGLPSHAGFTKYEHLPKEARFVKDRDVNLTEKYLKNLSQTGAGNVLSIFGAWDVFSDCPKLLNNFIKKKDTMTHVAEHWTSDHEFGRQFLNGPHPVKIERVTSIPENFPVTNEMVREFLEDDLDEVIEDGYMYMVSYPELQYLENGTQYKGKQKRYFAAPMCLLYAKEDGSLMPIAIQLNQGCGSKKQEKTPEPLTNGIQEQSSESAKAPEVYVEENEIEMSVEQDVVESVTHEQIPMENGLIEKSLEQLGAEMNEFDQRKEVELEKVPVFAEDVDKNDQDKGEEVESKIWTPRDASMWDYIKMWVKEADAQVHQVISRHLKTNLVMEVFSVATFRSLPSVHPVNKILRPHIENTIAVNTLGRQALYQHDGLFDKFLAVGGQHQELMKEAFKTFSIDELNFVKELEKRGVADEEKLPGYFYREDGLRLWKAIHKFVRTMLKLQYWSDGNVQADEEIQAWIQDIHLFGFPADENGWHHDVPSSFYTLAELVEFVTMIIFTSSCQTSALSAGMMDYYGILPNYPTMMMSPPPTSASQLSQEDIKNALPNKGKAAEIVAACFTLSRLGRDGVFLGNYPKVYIDDNPMKAAIVAFQEDLRYISEDIEERNTSQKLYYPYLHPSNIPCCISM